MQNKIILKCLRLIGTPLILGVVFFFLAKALEEHSYQEILENIKATPSRYVLLSLGLCALNYMWLALYDYLAFIYLGTPLSYLRALLCTFISYSFSHNVGFAIISGGAVRYRFYTHWGYSAGKVAKIIAFSGIHFWLGLLVLGGGALLLAPSSIREAFHISQLSSLLLGTVLLLVIVSYLVISWVQIPPLKFERWSLDVPSFQMALSALSIACVDWCLATSVLYALLPHHADIGFLHLLCSFMLAQLTGQVSHVPGGLGVFESVILISLGSDLSAAELISALILYRAIYYLLPLILGALVFISYELTLRVALKKILVEQLSLIRKTVSAFIPATLAIAVFLCGAVLLFSGSTPAMSNRLSWLGSILPLGMIEASHLVASIIGICLIILASAIRRKIALAYHITGVLLILGIVSSLLKGGDYEEAIILCCALTALRLSRQHFYRKASPFAGISFATIVGIALTVISSIWLGFFSYEGLAYRDELWWEFALEGDASRFLRASVGVMTVALAFGLRLLLRPAKSPRQPPNAEELELALGISREYPSSVSNLVMLGDKRLLFDAGSKAFLMYGVSGRSMIALGDPIGEESAKSEIAWEFRDLCDQFDSDCVFYQVSAEYLPLYIEMGLTLQKIGEEAIVPLNQFSLTGTSKRGFRSSINRLLKEGVSFDVIQPSQVQQILPELKMISDDWLKRKKAREKGFSLGYFDERYLIQLPLALARHNGRIIAFANLWIDQKASELSVDLMRHAETAPSGTMDFLFINIFQWGKDNGFQSFNMGMAPLSGLDSRRFAPLWNRLGAYVFRNGEEFYNFEGIRAYKEKFDPVWRPRYLACKGRWALPRVLSNLSSLIARGASGIILK